MKKTLRVRFSIVMLLWVTVLVAFLVGGYMSIAGTPYEWDTSVLEYQPPSIPPEFLENVSYEVFDENGQVARTESTDGKSLYADLHKMGWMICLASFQDLQALGQDSAWKQVDHERHGLDNYSKEPRPHLNAARDGFRKCVRDLEHLLQSQTKPELRLRLNVRYRKRNTIPYFYGASLWVLVTIAFIRIRRKRETKAEPTEAKPIDLVR